MAVERGAVGNIEARVDLMTENNAGYCQRPTKLENAHNSSSS